MFTSAGDYIPVQIDSARGGLDTELGNSLGPGVCV